MCKYCDMENGTDYIMDAEVSVLNEKIRFDLYLNGDKLRLCSGENYTSPLMKKKIRYCPMCGRKLNTD